LINFKKIQQKFEELRGYLHNLQNLSQLPEEELLTDVHKLASAKYHFQVSIECCVDIGSHIVAKKGFRTPKSYKDVIVILNENHILPDDFTKVMINMVKFRNLLVHLYWEVKPEEVINILKHDLKDFDKFKNYISDFVMSNQKED